MTEAIFSLVVWLILGGLGVAALWLVTVAGSGVLAVSSAANGRPAPWVPPITFIAGIILTISTLILVAYNVIASIVNIFNGG